MNDADYFDSCYDIGEDYLAHYGILGQKWGRRRYQNPDGTLTPLGRERLYGDSGKRKKISGVAWLDNNTVPLPYGGNISKNRLHRMMAAADAERRLNKLDYKIKDRKHKGRDTSRLEEKRRKIAVNKKLYSKDLLNFEKAIGRHELDLRNERIRNLIGLPLGLAVSAAAGAGMGVAVKYGGKLLTDAISSVSSHSHVSPLMADIIRETNKSPVMSTPINEIEVPVKTWEDIFTEEEWNNIKTWKDYD